MSQASIQQARIKPVRLVTIQQQARLKPVRLVGIQQVRLKPLRLVFNRQDSNMSG